MFSYDCHGELPQDEPIGQSLGEHTAKFKLLHKSDLPARWRPIAADKLAIEVPDSPWGRKYFHWGTQQLQRLEGTAANHGFPGLMLVSMHNFREPEDARGQAALCLRNLLDNGTPPREHVIQLLSPRMAAHRQ
jgi:hypothetical protein